jgi:hypothetical protein
MEKIFPRKRQVEITLVSQDNFFVMTPLHLFSLRRRAVNTLLRRCDQALAPPSTVRFAPVM